MEYKQFITDVPISFFFFLFCIVHCQVQHIIHQRLQSLADFKPSGLSRFPTQLFDETGQEIKNPFLLQNEQKIWVSYGEDYR